MSKNSMRDQMPWAAETVDWLREVFGKEYIDEQFRRSMGKRMVNGTVQSGFKPEPTFWIRESGRELGTRDTGSTSVVRWDEVTGLPYSAEPDWMVEARQVAERRGIKIRPADPNKPADVRREADELRQVLATAKQG
jgi:hypothetical protein